MSNSLTHNGQLVCLGAISGGSHKTAGVPASDGTTAGLILAATKIKLFGDTTSPTKLKGTPPYYGITEVPAGGGYTSGGKAITSANWTANITNFSANANVTLDDQTWTATGSLPASGTAGVKGAFLTDSGDFALAWWERTTKVTLQASDKIIADSLQIVMI